MKRVLLYFALATALAMAVVAWGCSASNSGDTFGNQNTGGSGAGDAQGQTNGSGTQSTGAIGAGGCLLNCNSTVGGSGGGSNGGQIVITPANPSLIITGGVIPTQAMTATLNGMDVTASVQWLYERPDIGDVTTSTFKPTGLVAGIGKLTATLSKSSGDTNVSVTIKKVVNMAGITPAQMAAFDSPSGPDPAMKVVYPLADTVFPLGVLGPDFQWNGAGASDIYRLTLTEKYYQYTEYFNTPAPAHHLIAETDWKGVESSGVGPQSDPLKFALSRMAGAQAYQAQTMNLHVAQGLLHGSVYYWELPDACQNSPNGRILRIKPDSPMVDQFFNPPDCYGCHTVSRDGKTMAAAFSVGSPFPQQTIDLTQNPAVLGALQMGKVAGTFMAFNDHGDKLLVSNDATGAYSSDVLKIINSANGAVLNPSALGSGCGEPAWSPNGKQIAGICGLTGSGWIFDASTGNLVVADVAADGITVSNAKPVVPQNAGPAGRPAFPSFSPDSAYIAYGRPTQGSRSTGNGDIWLAKNDGSTNKQLGVASSGNTSFNPVFAPLRAGGFYWLVYISKRDYGNQLVGASRVQLWVTAIDDPPNAADPSHPPFYIRGQESCAYSENAYYALDPCKAVGADCVSGIDCCNGQCIKDPNTNKYVCGTPPPPGMCSGDGNACKVNADCCNAPEVQCIDGFCQLPPPK